MANVWEIIDNEFIDVACERCAHEFLIERGIDHVQGENYTDQARGIYAVEDVFGEHANHNHVCACAQNVTTIS